MLKAKGSVYILAKRKDRSPAKTDGKKKQWSKKKNIAAGIIGAAAAATVAVIVLIIAFDLGPVFPIPSTDEQAMVVGTVAGFEVRYEELYYITATNKLSLDRKYGEYSTLTEDKKAQYDAELESAVMDDIKSNYVILSLCRKYGVDTDSRDVRKYVNDSVKSLVNNEFGGKKYYKKWLADNDLSDSFLRLVYKVNYLEAALVDELAARGDIKYNGDNLKEFVDFIVEDESYVKIIHAYYPRTEYANGKSAEENAEAALALIEAADTDEQRYSAMKSAIGNAPSVPGYSTFGSDFYITYGQMHKDYEDVAFSLDEYEASGILELEEGYYILMRVPKLRDEVGIRADDFLGNYEYAVLKQIADEQRKNISFVGNDYFSSLKLAELD